MADLQTELEQLATAAKTSANKHIGSYRAVDLIRIFEDMADQKSQVWGAVQNFQGPAATTKELLAIKNEAIELAGMAFILTAIAAQRYEDAQNQLPS